MSGSRPANAALQAFDDFLLKPFETAQLGPMIEAAEHRRSAPGPSDLAPQAVSAQENAGQDEPFGGVVLEEKVFASLRKSFRPEQLRELYGLTLDDVARRHARMLEHAAAGDLDALRKEAHAIKGGGGMMGARELYALGDATEGGTTLNTSLLVEFPAACVRLRRMLDAKFQND